MTKLTFPHIEKNCKNNTNEPFNTPTDVKNKLQKMVKEQVLYEQVVMLCRKDLNITEENKNKNEDKFKFQCKSAGSHHRFDLDFDFIEESFSAREPYFYKKRSQGNEKTQGTNT